MTQTRARANDLIIFIVKISVSVLGTPAADAATSDNARAIYEIAPIVASYRHRPSSTPTIPLVTSADNPDQQGSVHVINYSNHAGPVRILAVDDPDVFGQFGAGSGKWQLFVTFDESIQVMSLRLSPTGNLTNLSP